MSRGRNEEEKKRRRESNRSRIPSAVSQYKTVATGRELSRSVSSRVVNKNARRRRKERKDGWSPRQKPLESCQPNARAL
jgi:hypothetical protein